MTGHLDIEGSDAADEQLRVAGASGQAANIVTVENSAGTELFTVMPDGRVQWDEGLSYLGPSGELWVGGVVNAGTIWYNAVFTCSGVTTGGADAYVSFIGDSANSAYVGLRCYASVLDAISDTYNFKLDGESGGIEILNQLAGTIPFYVEGASGQTADLVNIDQNGGTTVLAVSSAGSVSLTAGTGITEFSTDGTLGGNSDDAVPTEKAVKTYVDNRFPITLEIVRQEAIAIGAQKLGLNDRANQHGFVVPDGKTLKVLAASLIIQTGASSGTYEVTAGIQEHHLGGGTKSDTDLLTITTTNTSSIEFASDGTGTIDSPLFELSGEAPLRLYIENAGTSPGALEAFAHTLVISGVLV